jgi:beta-1,4-N-acetylglucosaminyltransferase
MLLLVSYCIGFIATFFSIRVVSLLLSKNRNRNEPPKGSTVRTLVVLGSGGHTAEMLQLTKKLNFDRYDPLFYVLAEVIVCWKKKQETQ